MPLPLTRNRTYTTDSAPRSYDLNDLQDKIVDAWLGRHGDRTELVPLTALYASGTEWAEPVSHNGWYATTASSTLYVPLPLRDGDRLREIRAVVYRTAGAWTATLAHQNTAAGRDSSDYVFTPTITATTSAAGITELVLDCQDHTVGEVYDGFPIASFLVALNTTGVDNVLHQIKMVFDHP
jgi:hypothetical protein